MQRSHLRHPTLKSSTQTCRHAKTAGKAQLAASAATTLASIQMTATAMMAAANRRTLCAYVAPTATIAARASLPAPHSRQSYPGERRHRHRRPAHLVFQCCGLKGTHTSLCRASRSAPERWVPRSSAAIPACCLTSASRQRTCSSRMASATTGWDRGGRSVHLGLIAPIAARAALFMITLHTRRRRRQPRRHQSPRRSPHLHRRPSRTRRHRLGRTGHRPPRRSHLSLRRHHRPTLLRRPHRHHRHRHRHPRPRRHRHRR